jgi:hypothetical protein
MEIHADQELLANLINNKTLIKSVDNTPNDNVHFLTISE